HVTLDEHVEALDNRYQWICTKDKPKGPPIAIAIAVAPSNLIDVFEIPKRGGACPLLRTYQDHQATITSLSISPDQRYLLSGSKDGTIAIWPVGGIRERATDIRRWGVHFKKNSEGKLVASDLDTQGPLFACVKNGDILEQV